MGRSSFPSIGCFLWLPSDQRYWIILGRKRAEEPPIVRPRRLKWALPMVRIWVKRAVPGTLLTSDSGDRFYAARDRPPVEDPPLLFCNKVGWVRRIRSRLIGP